MGRINNSEFCTLEYRAHSERDDLSQIGTIILLVIKEPDDALRFFVRPCLSEVVASEDLSYFESLLSDFPERARLHPSELFQQLCSLSVGPLVTRESGGQLSDFPDIQAMASQFLPL